MDFLLQNLTIIIWLIALAYFTRQKTEYGINLIVFFLPIYLIRTEFFGIPTTALELGIYALFIVWIIKNYRDFNWQKIIPDKQSRYGIILLFVGATLSTVFSGDLKTSAGVLKGWFFDSFLFFIILVSTIKTYEQKSNILKIFFLSGVIVAAVGLIYFVFPDLGGVSYDGRLHGFYLSPNHLAMYLSPAFMIGAWLVYRKLSVSSWKENSSNIMFFLSIFDLFLVGLAIYFTYSYAAWFAIVVSLFFLVRFIVPPIKKKIFIGAIFLIPIVLLLSQDGTVKLENLKNLSYRSSYNSRLMIWRSAWEIGKDHWLVGIGPGNFQRYYLDYQTRFTEPYLEWAASQPHNIFLAFWLETGVLGLLGFIAILAWFFSNILSSLKKNLSDKESYLLVIVLSSLMIYTIVHGLFDTTYWKNDLAMIFWLNLALLVGIKKQPNLS